MFIYHGNCAILLWTVPLFLATPFILIKTDAAKINPKMLETRETRPVNITRSHDGDIIIIKDTTECDDKMCMEVSTSTAVKYRKGKNSRIDSNQCKCQCLNHVKTFREDTGICVNDVGECSLIPFVSSSISTDTAERIPFVFLPLKGQIIYPSKELLFANEFENMNCVVVGGVLLTSNGWTEMRTLGVADIPFRIFVDEDRRFLQWTGDTNIRNMMQGRLVMVHLACRIDGPNAKSVNTSPCISFRVVGSPIKTTSNVTEVQFALEPTAGSEKEPLTTNEYAVIAISSFCLGLMYIASVFLYIYFKKRKDQPSGASSEELNKNFSREDPNDFHAARSSYRRNSSLGPSVEFMDNPEPHVVKSNPLMKHFMSFNENNGFISDSSDADSAINHGDSLKQYSKNFLGEDEKMMSQLNADGDCLPEEGVAITEDGDGRSSDSGRTFHNGNVRRKLYFNPAYFEPSLLASPPPSAIEFLTKIREVISMAKGKMAAKRFQPSLNGIPEEQSNSNTLNSRRSSALSSQQASSKDCSGCPGCDAKKSSLKVPVSSKSCKNCGDKQKTIRKWLENVSTATESSSNTSTAKKTKQKDSLIVQPAVKSKQKELTSPVSSDDEEEEVESVDTLVGRVDVPIQKGFVKEKNIFIQLDSSKFKDDVPETGGSIPKIISHSLKKNIKDMIYSQNFVRDKVNVFESKTTSPSASVKKFEANEIYNNPRFNMDQDTGVVAPYSSVIKTKPEGSNQYANPVMRQSKPDTSSINHMPDMIYEAIEMEKKNKPVNYSLPTPDYYSSEYEMTKFKKNEAVSFIPFVPTPDYHTYGKNTLRSLKQYQPDSPIYSRKSPAYLVVAYDYETDSLERVNTYKSRTPLSTPTRSDFSSQPSPSALPMEEEVEIRNAIYNTEEGFRKDTDTIKKEREIDLQMRKSKIMYDTPTSGSMTIELEAISPDENDGMSATDSDQFEPDTLDRHSKINRTVLEKIKLDHKSTEEEDRDKFDEMGRVMTLEVRHSKRQRNMGFASLEKLPEKQKPKTETSVTPDVIASTKPSKEENFYSKKKPTAESITNRHILDEHEFKKSLISPPILTMESEVPGKRLNKTLRGDFINVDLLKLDTNFHENQIRNEFKSSLIKTVYHVELPTAPHINKEIFSDTAKKSKDFKNAWRRFIGIAEKNSNNNVKSDIKQEKVKDIIKRLNVVPVDVGKQREYDSGYLSAESVSNETLFTEIIPKPQINDKTIKIVRPRPQVAPPPVPRPPVQPQIKSNYLNNDDLVNISVYSSDDEQHSSIPDSDDEDGLLDDGTESGTESWKFFKT